MHCYPWHKLPAVHFVFCGYSSGQVAPNLVDNIKRRSTVCNLGPYLLPAILAFHQENSTVKQWTLKLEKLLHLF